MLTKKYLFVLVSTLAVLLIATDYIGTDRLCGGSEFTRCMQKLHTFFTTFIPVIPLFFFSAITFRMRDEIYQAWFRFARWAIPLSMFLILVAPEYSHDRMYPIEKGFIALLSSVIFIIVSAAIILYRLNASRPRG